MHRGRAVALIEHFIGPGRARPMVDVLQSEHGSWFLQKRNRNMVVEVTGDVAVGDGDDFCWLTLGQLRRLLLRDNVVNMDSRTILSCLPLHAPAGPGSPFRTAMVLSLAGDGPARHRLSEVVQWLSAARAASDLRRRTIPLRDVQRWVRRPEAIQHEDGRYFEVVAVDVQARGREISQWSQPMFAPRRAGVAAFLAKRLDGVLHVLVHARAEAGSAGIAEIAPTVQCDPAGFTGWPADRRPPFLDTVLNADPASIRLDVIQSEEGGRLYHAEIRNMLVEVGDDFPDEVPADYCWVTLGQLMRLVKHSNYLNVEARGLLVCLQSLW
jgi:oxidase EvaA